jgi:hypothetical protein
MDEFDSGCQPHSMRAATGNLRAGKCHHRADAFTASGNQMSGQFWDQWHVTGKPLQNHCIDGFHIIGKQIDQRVKRNQFAVILDYRISTHSFNLSNGDLPVIASKYVFAQFKAVWLFGDSVIALAIAGAHGWRV